MRRCIVPDLRTRTVKHKGRLSAAKELYGDSNSLQSVYDVGGRHKGADEILMSMQACGQIPSFGTLLHCGSPSTSSSNSESTPNHIEGVSSQSLARRLCVSELSYSLAKHLVDSFVRELAICHVPVADIKPLFETFQASGSKIHKMPPNSQVLLLVLLALGARLSNHSELVGDESPPIDQIFSPHYKAVWQDGALLEFGKKREGACRYLLYRAKDILDQTGICLSQPDPMVIAALAELEMMLLGSILANSPWCTLMWLLLDQSLLN